jgi:hypothetical protein
METIELIEKNCPIKKHSLSRNIFCLSRNITKTIIYIDNNFSDIALFGVFFLIANINVEVV